MDIHDQKEVTAKAGCVAIVKMRRLTVNQRVVRFLCSFVFKNVLPSFSRSALSIKGVIL
jgi:hypothetical protein